MPCGDEPVELSGSRTEASGEEAVPYEEASLLYLVEVVIRLEEEEAMPCEETSLLGEPYLVEAMMRLEGGEAMPCEEASLSYIVEVVMRLEGGEAMPCEEASLSYIVEVVMRLEGKEPIRVIYDLKAMPVPKMRQDCGYDGTHFSCYVSIKCAMMMLGQQGKLRRVCGA
ncbi:Hypothetical predicted protein [Olea europaea subsp. europaea]|uniref:Uncharacterized protein n=1 Tax=Olea europaea subsp. europaea TaxID=158383 RepID=A0A8S0R9L1_OLEEU|nr:Hypothetical predicted protein [Olea europaea subsp. europaea]